MVMPYQPPTLEAFDPRYKFVSADDESMAPTIRRGDLVAVDASDLSLREGLVMIAGELDGAPFAEIYRLQIIGDGRRRLAKDGPHAPPPLEVSLAWVEARIVGRPVSVTHRLS